jgi:fatty acid synthase
MAMPNQESISYIKTIFLLGIRNRKNISSNSTLSELGMDSLTAVEIKQCLEREFGVFLMPQEIRTLTFACLQDMSEKGQEEPASRGTQLLLLYGN